MPPIASHSRPPLPIIVMGVSGSGKSTLGGLLAEALGCAFLEGDAFHAAASVEKMRNGVPLTDEDRWPWLDRLGGALEEAVAADGVAVAACSALRRPYRDRLRGAVGAPIRFLFLDNSPAETLARMGGRSGHYMPPGLLDSQFATLERPDPDEGVLTLRTDASPEALCRAALDWLGEERDRG